MKKWRLIVLKNQMVFGNFISNLVGTMVVGLISLHSIDPPTSNIQQLSERVDSIFLPIVWLLIFLFTLYYERPIRKFIDQKYRYKQPVDDSLKTTAKRRLLNEPLVLITVDLLVWLIAAAVYPLVFWVAYEGDFNWHRVVFRTLMVCMVTLIVAFYFLEHILQKQMVPHFFPEGGLSKISKSHRIRIRLRIAALILACNIIPCISFMMILRETSRISLEPEILLDLLRKSIFTNSLIFIITGLFLARLVSLNLSKPLEEIISVVKNIRRGNFDSKVRVMSNDEIGYTGDAINEMAKGLQEREKMRRSLDLAREVQLNLLPKSPPNIKGLDIAGQSIYCDQTGGDYFDFFEPDGQKKGQLAVLVGDVSGHGIPSALLMASARAYLRLRSFLPGTIAQTVTDVNIQLCRDVGYSGQFMTLFFMEIDVETGKIHWVRAGHDPAILYDRSSDSFEELMGKGLPMGVDEHLKYEENGKTGIPEGQVIIIGTDGIWEARGPDGKMFGKDRLYKILRQKSAFGAEEILNEIMSTLKDFKNGLPLEDDATLVVIRFTSDLKP
jgi:sigma-B regulation protein RsbU (phosphoserine phosphatase)